ncbi:MAG TPA: ATP-binding cassette domain-containing protein [Candidatus Competibacteraceae bacterium]|nr:ATP-binding cassette domain-containing protein [Candidatus Competibacteraceae bacterium]MCP5133349.1 ATP-binding cassette domain-containing protein [Gammaproteobacteria bacterium]HPF58227.1 ATP-binding cassette domain-containing protein [Candidatus Competibacteraceae bacterium]HRY17107.1 ATP-binding cassette domain-containing protein [Candidatus Competibacteraceae bacterium]
MAGLRLEGLSTALLRDVHLTLAAGERLFLSGASGSGKSLLLRAIADLDPHRGEVWLDDIPRSRLPPPEWRRRVGLLPSESYWWAKTVGEHWPASTTHLKPERLLNMLGFDTDVCGWPITRLSTGERQRLALARLLLNQPQALLLDEATAHLDPVNRSRVETVLEDYGNICNAALLWVSHDPEQRARLGGRRLVIRKNRLEPEI